MKIAGKNIPQKVKLSYMLQTYKLQTSYGDINPYGDKKAITKRFFTAV